MRQILSGHLRFWWYYYLALILTMGVLDMLLLSPQQPVILSLMWTVLAMVPVCGQTGRGRSRVLMALPVSRKTVARTYWLLGVVLPALFFTVSLPLSGRLHSPVVYLTPQDLAIVLAGSLACAGAGYGLYVGLVSGANTGEEAQTETVWQWNRPPNLTRMGAVWDLLVSLSTSSLTGLRGEFFETVRTLVLLAGLFLPFWFKPSTPSLLPYLGVGLLGLILPVLAWVWSERPFTALTGGHLRPRPESATDDNRPTPDLDEPPAEPLYRFLSLAVSALLNAIVYSLLLMALLVFARAHFGGVNFVWMVLVLTSANFEFELNGIRGVVIRHFQRALTGAVVVLVFATMLHIALIGSNFLIIALLFGGLVGNPLFWKPLRVLRALPFSGTQLAATLMLLQAVGLLGMVPVWGTFQWLNQEHFLNGFTASLLLPLLGLICITNSVSMFFGRKWWGLLLCTYLGLWFGYILVEELENHYGAVVPAALGSLLGRVSTTFWWVSGFAAVLAAFCLTVFLLRSSKPYRASRL